MHMDQTIGHHSLQAAISRPSIVEDQSARQGADKTSKNGHINIGWPSLAMKPVDSTLMGPKKGHPNPPRGGRRRKRSHLCISGGGRASVGHGKGGNRGRSSEQKSLVLAWKSGYRCLGTTNLVQDLRWDGTSRTSICQEHIVLAPVGHSAGKTSTSMYTAYV